MKRGTKRLVESLCARCPSFVRSPFSIRTWQKRRRSTPTADERHRRTVPTIEMPMIMMSVTERKAGGEGGEGGGGDGGGCEGGGGCGGGDGGGGDGATMTEYDMPLGGRMEVTSTPKTAEALSSSGMKSCKISTVVAAAAIVPVDMTVSTLRIPEGIPSGGAEGGAGGASGVGWSSSWSSRTERASSSSKAS
jgi:hypothetical protein